VPCLAGVGVDIRAGNNRFKRTIKIEFPPSSICLAVCKTGASSACLLITKLALITLYDKFKQFTNILILLNNYVTF